MKSASTYLHRQRRGRGPECRGAPSPAGCAAPGPRDSRAPIPVASLAFAAPARCASTGKSSAPASCWQRARWRLDRDDRRPVRQWRDPRPAGCLHRPQRGAMRLLHPGMLMAAADYCANHGAVDRAAIASIFPEITAAATATKRSSTPSRKWRGPAPRRETAHDRSPFSRKCRPFARRPAQQLHRPQRTAPQHEAPGRGPRLLHGRCRAAAPGPCRVRALAACARPHQAHRHEPRAKSPGVIRVFTGRDLAEVCDPWVATLALSRA